MIILPVDRAEGIIHRMVIAPYTMNFLDEHDRISRLRPVLAGAWLKQTS